MRAEEWGEKDRADLRLRLFVLAVDGNLVGSRIILSLDKVSSYQVTGMSLSPTGLGPVELTDKVSLVLGEEFVGKATRRDFVEREGSERELSETQPFPPSLRVYF